MFHRLIGFRSESSFSGPCDWARRETLRCCQAAFNHTLTFLKISFLKNAGHWGRSRNLPCHWFLPVHPDAASPKPLTALRDGAWDHCTLHHESFCVAICKTALVMWQDFYSATDLFAHRCPVNILPIQNKPKILFVSSSDSGCKSVPLADKRWSDEHVHIWNLQATLRDLGLVWFRFFLLGKVAG